MYLSYRVIFIFQFGTVIFGSVSKHRTHYLDSILRFRPTISRSFQEQRTCAISFPMQIGVIVYLPEFLISYRKMQSICSPMHI